jgi:signal transduction histidine kinase
MELLASRYTLLCKLGLILNQNNDMEAVAESALEKMSGILDFERCSIALIDRDAKYYNIKTQFELRPDVMIADLKKVELERGIAGRTIRRKRPTYVPHMARGGDNKLGVGDPGMEDGSLRSVLCIPLEASGAILGALIFGAVRSDAFPPPDIHMARQVASFLALAIERQRQRESADVLMKRLEAKRVSLEETIERLEQVNLELDTFIYSASHDIRAPLLSISGLVELALSSEENGENVDLPNILMRIKRNVRRLDQLVTDVLQVNRARRMERVIEGTNLEVLLQEVIESVRDMSGREEIDIDVSCNVAPDLPLEQRRLRQVFANLISNAIKYADVTSQDAWIRIKAWQDDSLLRVTVTDNGIGVASDQVEQIFELFYRGTSQSFGSGLGLYLVRRHCEAMGGEVSLVSNEYGSEFKVTVPLIGAR